MDDRNDSLMALGAVWTNEHEFAAVAQNAVVQVGFTTGAYNYQFDRRTYACSENKMRISLYEVAFTGGTNILRTYNRNQAGPVNPPVQMKAGVTFTPNTVIASLLLRGDATGTKATTTIPEDEPLILKKNTSYVLTFQNLAGQDADIDFRINTREQTPSEMVR
jgi:hypothetical protein